MIAMKCPACKNKITYEYLEKKNTQAGESVQCPSCKKLLIYVEDELCERGIEGGFIFAKP
jgi:uncharacterized protein YbaR (Trm112 family)